MKISYIQIEGSFCEINNLDCKKFYLVTKYLKKGFLIFENDTDIFVPEFEVLAQREK